jgi:hypothetical protein
MPIFKGEIQEIGNVLGLEGRFLIEWGFEHIIDAIVGMQAVINPPPPLPQTEMVEVAGFAVFFPDGSGSFHLHENIAKAELASFYGAVESHQVKIVYARVIPPKVKHREDISDCKSYGNGTHLHIPIARDIPVKAQIFAEWES